ncbi:MAG TPA: vWA domain-containing protein [Gaiellaceae bacterium]|nr:vWA domain-containing protein [Gaiellaceae bacterium]
MRIPLADLPELRRPRLRTALVRALLAVALLALAVGAAVASAHPSGRSLRFLAPGSNGIVVLDLSASISSDTYQRIGETLRELAATNGRYGLVVFSDVAYEALPPGTPSAELKPYERFFTLPKALGGFLPQFPINPWTNSFSAGTRISAGLGLALDIIRAQHLRHAGVVLVSDLDDDTGDLKSLASVSLAYRQLGIPVKIVALDPEPQNVQLFSRLLAQAVKIQNANLPGERVRRTGPAVPPWLAGLTAVVALVLAANELWGARLTWRTA